MDNLLATFPRGEGDAVLAADLPEGEASGNGTARQAASGIDPLADHTEAARAGKLVGKRAEADAGHREPALHAAFPVAGEAEDGGGGRDVDGFDGGAEAENAALEDVNDRLRDALFFGAVSEEVILPEIVPVGVVVGGQEAGYGGFAGWGEGGVEVEEAEGELLEGGLGVDAEG